MQVQQVQADADGGVGGGDRGGASGGSGGPGASSAELAEALTVLRASPVSSAVAAYRSLRPQVKAALLSCLCNGACDTATVGRALLDAQTQYLDACAATMEARREAKRAREEHRTTVRAHMEKAAKRKAKAKAAAAAAAAADAAAKGRITSPPAAAEVAGATAAPTTTAAAATAAATAATAATATTAGGGYKCRRCGLPKKGHVCAFAEEPTNESKAVVAAAEGSEVGSKPGGGVDGDPDGVDEVSEMAVTRMVARMNEWDACGGELVVMSRAQLDKAEMQASVALELACAPVDRSGQEVRPSAIRRHIERRDQVSERRTTMRPARDFAEVALHAAVASADALLHAIAPLKRLKGSADGAGGGVASGPGLLLSLEAAVVQAERRGMRQAALELQAALEQGEAAHLSGDGDDGIGPGGRWATSEMRDAYVGLADLQRVLCDSVAQAELQQDALRLAVGRTPPLGCDRHGHAYWLLPAATTDLEGCAGSDHPDSPAEAAAAAVAVGGLWRAPLVAAPPKRAPPPAPAQDLAPGGLSPSNPSPTSKRKKRPAHTATDRLAAQSRMGGGAAAEWAWLGSVAQWSTLAESLDDRGHMERGLQAALRVASHGVGGVGPLPSALKHEALQPPPQAVEAEVEVDAQGAR